MRTLLAAAALILAATAATAQPPLRLPPRVPTAVLQPTPSGSGAGVPSEATVTGCLQPVEQVRGRPGGRAARFAIIDMGVQAVITFGSGWPDSGARVLTIRPEDAWMLDTLRAALVGQGEVTASYFAGDNAVRALEVRYGGARRRSC